MTDKEISYQFTERLFSEFQIYFVLIKYGAFSSQFNEAAQYAHDKMRKIHYIQICL